MVEPILTRRTDQALRLEKLERSLPASWQEQRTLLSAGGAVLGLVL
jgi:hypothetical protein